MMKKWVVIGAHSLVERIVSRIPAPAFAIVGEPTDMRLGVAHNGVTGAHTRFRGVAAHASDPSLGVNAIDAAATFVRELHKIANLPAIADHDCTFNVGQIKGGTATNIVAERCSVHWEYRAARAQDAAIIKKTIADYLEGNDFAALTVSNEIELDVPQFSSHLSDSWLQMLSRCGAKLPPITVPFGSEAGIFERSRIPSVVCGPGSIDQAHRPDEWIACAALRQGDGFMSKLGAWASQIGSD